LNDTKAINQIRHVTSKKRCIFTSTVKLHVKTTERMGWFTNKLKGGGREGGEGVRVIVIVQRDRKLS